jgi:uncharacterized protein
MHIKILLICLSVFLSSTSIFAKSKYQAVFELTSDEHKTWDGILGNVKNAREALKEVDIAVVAHSKGIGIMTKKNKKFQDQMKELSQKGVAFLACKNTMEGKNIPPNELLPFVSMVDSGVAEVIRKQQDGWAYVKVGK